MYRCVHCSKLYDDGSHEVLTGCSACGRKFFFFIRKEKLPLIENKELLENEFEADEKEKIEEDIREIAGIENEETPVFLDFESVKVLKEGKYILDISKLFSGKPAVYQLEDGKYIVDLSMLAKPEGKKD